MEQFITEAREKLLEELDQTFPDLSTRTNLYKGLKEIIPRHLSQAYTKGFEDGKEEAKRKMVEVAIKALPMEEQCYGTDGEVIRLEKSGYNDCLSITKERLFSLLSNPKIDE